MPTTFRPYHPEQDVLLPSNVRGWLPEGHLAHHVSDLVDGLDLEAFYAPCEGDGRRKSPYDPRMLLKVLIYGCATGVFSSRGLARKLEEDVAFRVLGAGNFPSRRTIRAFRRRHLGDFKRLFVEVVRIAGEMGVARFGKLSVDGTKVRANASKRKAMSCGRMVGEARRLSGGIDALAERARENFTDPRSRIMKTATEGFQQCCNAQLAVEGSNQLIVAAGVSANASDQGLLLPLVDEAEAVGGERSATVPADAGYCNEADLAALENRGVDGHVALGREGKRQVEADAEKHPAKARMAAKPATEAGRAHYAQCKWRVEAPIGWIKEALGFRRFGPRGLEQVRGEWDLVCLALNVKRMRGLRAA